MLETQLEAVADGRRLLTLAGDLDYSGAVVLRDVLRPLLDDADCRVIVDMTAVHFVDSSGLGVLLNWSGRARRDGGGFALVVAPESQPKRALDLIHVEKVLPHFSWVPEALHALSN